MTGRILLVVNPLISNVEKLEYRGLLRSELVNDSNRSLRLAPNEGVPKIAAIHIRATNSFTDIPAARINARSVPGATTRCWALTGSPRAPA